MQIGVLGATGPAGRGVAARLADLGHDVIAGSRDRSRAEATVGELRVDWGERLARLTPATNAEAAAAADLVVNATTWEGSVPTAREHAAALAGKVVVAMGNGLERVGREFHLVLPEGTTIAEGVQAAAPGARVVAAFHLVPAAAFAALDDPIPSDVVVVADDDEARRTVMELALSIPGMRAFDGGSLANAIGLEAFAALLLSINVRHRGKASVRLEGVDGYRPAGGAS
ncbi:MAG TPA: NADPH-dependent F420 reductase [Acidimicrobiia bacterium]|nr:NADPH-dependent F420 reductase [Acidimicrobiia bacterium]